MSRNWDRIVRIPLAPVLLAQALWVATRAQRFPEAAGVRRGQAGAGPPLRVLVLGDSSAAGVGVATQDDALAGHLLCHLGSAYQVEWRLVARNGITTARLLRQMRCAQLARFDVALIALGVNDVKNGVPMGRWRRDYNALLDLLAGRFGARLICVSGLPPIRKFPLLPQPLRWVLGRRAERFDAELRALADRRADVAHIALDFPLDETAMADDGFHPGPPVYDAWARAVAGVIRTRIGDWPGA